MEQSTKSVSKKELFLLFTKLGVLGFGGPPAHIALMREEVVIKRQWLSQDEFFDLIGATNLIPGPNSTELAIHIGHKVGGLQGLLLAGVAFITPAFLSVLTLAYFYMEYGSLPELGPILSGIRPVIVAIVFMALWKFRSSAVRNIPETVIFLMALLAVILGLNEIFIIFLAGLVLAAFKSRIKTSLAFLPVLFTKGLTPVLSGTSLFFFFLKIGSVLFGSGYVLLAFLKNELVDERMWLTSAQLLDAVTVGQLTPGPVFTTATFIGYVLLGFKGAGLATLGIFLPSFFFVAVSAPYISKLRSSTFFSFFLNGVNAASFALMASVSFELARKSLFDFPTIVIGVFSFLLLKYSKINSAYLILAGGVLGFFFL